MEAMLAAGRSYETKVKAKKTWIQQRSGCNLAVGFAVGLRWARVVIASWQHVSMGGKLADDEAEQTL